jgi:hypothetical protein
VAAALREISEIKFINNDLMCSFRESDTMIFNVWLRFLV